MKDRSQNDKVSKLDELSKFGLEPRIEILRYGLSQEQALHIEAAAIELLGIYELTNQVWAMVLIASVGQRSRIWYMS